jgi:4-hydroxy-tetrahydrodipicolinate reductase
MDFQFHRRREKAVQLPVVINGALGKMGGETGAVVLDDASVRLVAAVERPGHPRAGDDYGTCIGKGAIGVKVTDSWKDIDGEKTVIIDFSSPPSTDELLRLAKSKKMRLVIGTTGLSEQCLGRAKKIAESMPVLVSPNMSLGVNLLFSLTALASSILKNDFDIEIIEAHHRLKKDAPSGTARRLGEIIAETYGLPYEQVVRNGRSGNTGAGRSKNEVGIHAIRGGDIVGDHTVLFAGMGERIELRHSAHTRATLARGAVTAAKWLATKGPGYYSMKDVLGIK